MKIKYTLTITPPNGHRKIELEFVEHFPDADDEEFSAEHYAEFGAAEDFRDDRIEVTAEAMNE